MGLPKETMSDIKATVDLIKKIKGAFLKHRKQSLYMPEINLSINQFEPQPGTPFADYKVPSKKEIKKRYQYLKKELAGTGNIKMTISLT